MFQPARLIAIALCVSSLPLHALQETWETGYTKDDATGAHVLGHWDFEKADGLNLQGAVLNPKGRFGGGLESFPGFPVEDKQHGAVVAVKPVRGAFTLEMWIRPKAEFRPELRCYLLDKKYVDPTDYQWQVSEADKGGMRRMFVTPGLWPACRTLRGSAARRPPIAPACPRASAGSRRLPRRGFARSRRRDPGCRRDEIGHASICLRSRLRATF